MAFDLSSLVASIISNIGNLAVLAALSYGGYKIIEYVISREKLRKEKLKKKDEQPSLYR